MDQETEQLVEQLRLRKEQLEQIVREKTAELRGVARALNAFDRKRPNSSPQSPIPTKEPTS